MDNGADIEIKSNDDTSPLIIASCYDQLETVKLLMERSADINAKIEDGNTALSYAKEYGNEEVAFFQKSKEQNSFMGNSLF